MFTPGLTHTTVNDQLEENSSATLSDTTSPERAVKSTEPGTHHLLDGLPRLALTDKSGGAHEQPVRVTSSAPGSAVGGTQHASNESQIAGGDSTPAPGFSDMDMKFLYSGKFGLRHHDDHHDAMQEAESGTKGGDAVPLNPLGSTSPLVALSLGRGRGIPADVTKNFAANVDRFIGKSLERTINIEHGVTTPKQVAERAMTKSTFLLVGGMTGTDVPRDVDNRDYGGLGKAGKQKISGDQIKGVVAFDESGINFMKSRYGEKWDKPISTRAEGDDVSRSLVSFFSKGLKDTISGLRADQT